MICAKTSLPWFIGGPRNGRHHGPANAAIRVEIETRQNHKLSFANQIVIAPLALNVGTALCRHMSSLFAARRAHLLPGSLMVLAMVLFCDIHAGINKILEGMLPRFLVSLHFSRVDGAHHNHQWTADLPRTKVFGTVVDDFRDFVL